MANNLQDQIFRNVCFEALAEEGYRPSLRGGCIEFQIKYNPFYVWFDEKKASVFQMQTLYKYDISSLDYANAVRLANQQNASFADVKTAVMDADFILGSTVILFRSECHVPDFFEVVFKDKITALQESVRSFRQQVSAEEITRLAQSLT